MLNEVDRLRDKPKHLCTLQQGISGAQMDEMQAENVILVAPKPYIAACPKDHGDRIWTLARFAQYAKKIGANKMDIKSPRRTKLEHDGYSLKRY